MSGGWIVVIGAGLGTMALKAVGPVLLGGRALPERLGRMLALLAPAVFAALVVTETFGVSGALALDHRSVGLAVAGVAAARRSPLLITVLLAAAATALARVVL